MKLTCKVVRIESAECFMEKKPRVTFRVAEADGMYCEIRLPMESFPRGTALDEEFLLLTPGDDGLDRSELTCANCGEVSTNPGQFVKDCRWVCTESCRKELCSKQSYDDLAASGGIVDAP